MSFTSGLLIAFLGGVLAQTGEGPEFRPRRVVRPFPALKNPRVIKASAVKNQVTDAELVLGVEINGKARAYPINMLTGPSREVINDVVGGRAIAATW